VAAAAGGPPEPIRSLLVKELAALVCATDGLLASFGEGVTILTQRGGPRPRYRTYLALMERLERLIELLKLNAAAGKRKPVDPVAHLEALRSR
jgi:hypothetical protein